MNETNTQIIVFFINGIFCLAVSFYWIIRSFISGSFPWEVIIIIINFMLAVNKWYQKIFSNFSLNYA